MLYAGIEGGGTKFVCAIGRAPLEILDSASFATTDAPGTLAECVRFLTAAQARHGQIAALGIACFGPIELRKDSAEYGRVLATPKPGWSDADVLGPLRAALPVPIALDVDVGAAALAELRLGAGRGKGSLAYVTVGTGIGGAVAPADGCPRLMHAEMGHIPVRRDPGDTFAGCCPFHGDCLEGLASGPAVRARWGCDLHELPSTHEGRAIIAEYLGQMAASIALMLSVEQVVIGGGVMSDGTLLPLVRVAATKCLNGYLPMLKQAAQMERYIQAPGLGSRAGIVGALLLAQNELTS